MSQTVSSVLHVHNRSSISQKSISHYLSHLSEGSELTDSELVKQVNELKHQVKVLTLENEIFERTITRLEPALMNGVYQALEYAARKQSNSSMTLGSPGKSRSSGAELLIGPSKMFLSTSRVSTYTIAKRRASSAFLQGTLLYGNVPRINVLERSELVTQEMQIVTMNLEKVKKKAANDHALLKAKLEEIGVRVADVDKAVANFQQEVIVEGWDKIAQRIPAEIWIRFMTEWVKTIDGQIGKLRLRTSTLNTQYHTLRSQIRAKTELNESLRPVDFEKLKIQNNECLEIIDQKLLQLEELKQMAGDANLYLTIHKKAMLVQDNHLKNVRKAIANRVIRTVEVNKEKEIIKVQADALAKKVEQIQKVRLKYEVPDIMDYVGVKSELTDLKHNVKRLEECLKIAQIAVSSITKKLNSIYFLQKQKSKNI